MQAHIISSGVVMDVAAFKVSHSVDIDATALRAVRVRLSSIGALDHEPLRYGFNLSRKLTVIPTLL